MDERRRFIVRLLEGEKMARLCRQFGISRVTGYKIYERCEIFGLEGLDETDFCSRPRAELLARITTQPEASRAPRD